MKKTVLGLLVVLGVTFSSLKFSYSKNPQEIHGEFAPKGMVAYAASYSSDPKNEPKYSTQNSKTFQYLNLGKTHDLYRGDSVKVGIIDSGINYDHEDFMVNSASKVKGDSKYYEYQSSSWVYYKASQHGYSYIDDTLGHGTNVAATVAAAVNSIGGTGLAPNVELYVYKVTNSSNGYEFGAIQNALMDAKTLGLDVINMSFQSYEHAVSYGSSSMAASSGCSTILSYYLNQAYNAGITLVGAAGNYNTDEPSYPGSNNHVINVGSLNQTGTDKAGFSNYGNTIDLVAPGYVHVADKGTNTSYKDTSGTSFSAPLVTAAIALYKQQNPSATPSQIESALYASCDPIDDSGSAYTNWAGNGALNVAKFLGCDVDNGPVEIVINNPEIVNNALELEVGDYLDLDYDVNGVGTFDDSVNFYTLMGADDICTVSNTGRITATGVGEEFVIIESNADSSIYTSIDVTVKSSGSSSPTVTSVSVSPSSLSLDLNGTKTGTLTATVNGTNNPSQAVTWSSSNTSIATVSSSGVVTAKATGSATITATSQEDSTKSGTCTVTVTASKILSSISISGYTTSFAEGDTFSFGGIVTAHYTDSTTANVTSESTFTGYNMTTVGNHNVTVSYTYKGVTKTQTYQLTITQGTLSSIELSGQTTVYQKNNGFAFDGTCTATFANGYKKTVTPTSVTSPDMSTAGVKTIIVSFTYNGNTKTTTYDIIVNSNRVVMETTTTTGYSVLATITWTSSTPTITPNTAGISVSTSGYTTFEDNSIRLGSGSNTGTVTVTCDTSKITKVTASAKTYGSDTGVTLTIGGTNNSITSSYADYEKEYATATNSVAIATVANKKRAYIQTIKIYETKDTVVETDISNSEDCLGLETFITKYMHMDYVQNLGYCKDEEHHYYSSAKTAFNALNTHQRSLFTTNSAYSTEWARLSAWASFNGDSLNGSNILASNHVSSSLNVTYEQNSVVLVLIVGFSSLSTITCLLIKKKRKSIK